MSDKLDFLNQTEVILEGTSAENDGLQCFGHSIHFYGIAKLELLNISMVNCQIICKGFSNASYNSIIYLFKVSINNSNGTGIEFENVKNITIDSTRLTNNLESGMKVKLTNTPAESHSLLLDNCLFKDNGRDIDSVKYGGGLGINVTVNFSLTVKNTEFDSNQAGYGGSIGIIYTYFTSQIKHTFLNCTFKSNKATHGGGLYIDLVGHSFCFNYSMNTITFDSCEWTSNRGIYGSAVMIKSLTGQYFTNHGVMPLFRRCNITNNSVIYNSTHPKYWQDYQVRKSTRGTVYVKNALISVQDQMKLADNSGSAIVLISSSLIVLSGAAVTFENNNGFNGAGLSMKAESHLLLEGNINLTFCRNTAQSKGGAIYQKGDETDSPILFLPKSNIEDNKTHKLIIFHNNNASEGGDSIFSTSMNLTNCNDSIAHKIPYFPVSLQKEESINLRFLKCNSKEIQTYAQMIKGRNTSKTKYIIPGKPTKLFNDSSNSLISIDYKVVSDESNIKVDSAYKTISNDEIVLHGDPGSSGPLRLFFSELVLSVTVELRDCPPGYFFDNSTTQKSCKCPTDLQNNNKLNAENYKGITKCNSSEFTAYVSHGYWAGYFNSSFCTSECPLGFCYYSRNYDSFKDLKHKVVDSTETNLYKINTCGKNREGTLCGKCQNGSSVYFHDTELSCKENQNCKLGVLKYLLSEILPATLVFVSIIFLEISFTSGGISGFIFYMQALESLQLINSVVWYESKIFVFLKILLFFVHSFNLSFFSHLDFCLFENARSLDIIAFNYITLIYSLILVIALVILMKLCPSKYLAYLRLNKVKKSNSTIHGLSSFLVLCYFQCTRINLRLLTRTNICGHLRVYYDGDLEYFRGEHLKYAIPALFFLCGITISLPVLLFCYPLCYKIVALCNLQESLLMRILCTYIPLEKYKPFFDSFQGCFKDEHRYFSSIYFLYRLLLLTLLAGFFSFINTHLAMEIAFILMIILHVTIMPYKKKWHNIIDGLLLSLLLLLNTFTIIYYNQQYLPNSYRKNSRIISSLQIVLAWIPVCVMTLYVISLCFLKVKKLLKSRRTNDNYIGLPSLVDAEEERLKMSEISYKIDRK